MSGPSKWPEITRREETGGAAVHCIDTQKAMNELTQRITCNKASNEQTIHSDRSLIWLPISSGHLPLN